MAFISFGKVRIKEGFEEAFLKDCKSQGLNAIPMGNRIYDFGMTQPNLLSEEVLRKQAGLIGLRYSE